MHTNGLHRVLQFT
jgi:hypothetical protein